MGNYKPQEFAEMLGVTVKTLQRWDNDGKLKAFRTPTDRRYYTHKQNDLISIIHVFSCKIYGLRKYKNQIKEDAEIAKGIQNGDKPDIGTKIINQ